MPLELEALLEPVPGDDPCGADLRYHPLTDKIKEARRQEDDSAQGVWKRDLKVADYPQVLKLGSEALSKHSKDLQIAAWMVEASLHREGFGGLKQGLELLRRLLEQYWDGVYPRMDEDGDLELRATPLSWVGISLDSAVRATPLLKSGLNWYHYRDSRSIPSEEEANRDQTKQQERAEALEDGRMSPEEFEAAFQTANAQDLQSLHGNLAALMEYVREFGTFCDERFGDATPDFTPLVRTLEEIHGTVRVLFKRKDTGGFDAPAEEQTFEEPTDPQWEQPGYATEAGAATAPVRRRAPISSGPEPVSEEDAVARIASALRYMRREQPGNPAPYLIARALRWGQLRASDGYQDLTLLSAPTTETRVELKRLAMEGNWDGVREAAESAASEPCGRAWLDLQRYAVNACRYTGNDLAARAIVSELRALLGDYPELHTWTLADDTPTANAETLQWLKDEAILPKPPEEPQAASPSMDWAMPAPVESYRQETPSGEPAPPDAYELAMEAARNGRTGEAVTILSQEIAREGHERGRFLRKTQLAQVCLAVGNAAMARPILQALADEVTRRGLEEWESPELISQPLALLYRCTNPDDPEREKLYSRICRLDPERAMELMR